MEEYYFKQMKLKQFFRYILAEDVGSREDVQERNSKSDQQFLISLVIAPILMVRGTHTRTHTQYTLTHTLSHIHTHIYMYVCMCVCINIYNPQGSQIHINVLNSFLTTHFTLNAEIHKCVQLRPVTSQYYIHSHSSLFYDRSIAFSKASFRQSEIQCFLFQFQVS